MTNKGWLIFIGIVVLALSGAIYLSRQDKVALPADLNHNAVQAASDANGQIADHKFGKEDSPVVLLEYGDFQCGGCAAAEPVINEVMAKYQDRVLFVFRNRMLPYHQNARAAASFAEAAGLQGKYWQMHREIYESQRSWENLSGQERTNFFTALIQQIGGDVEKALADIDGAAISKKLAFDSALADKHQVTGTPTLLLNGEVVGAHKDGQIVSSNTPGAQQIWSDPKLLEDLVIKPALEKAGLAN